MFDEKLKFWSCPRGSVCLMILISPQFWIVWCSTSMSCGFEVKLDPDERDSQTCCGKEKHLPPRLSAWVRLMPNSANWLVASAVPLSPLSAAVIGDWFDLPSKSDALTVTTFAPQHGMLSVLTKHVPLLPPMVVFVLSIHVSRWKFRLVPPLR